MDIPLAILIVEDSESDAQLIVRLLKKAGYEVVSERVETAEQMRIALQSRDWGIVISDYSLPQFDGCAALELLKEMGKDIPFLVVSGAIGEETAVAMMKAGAHDYLMKGNLARLAPAVERELEQAEDRYQRKRTELALLESEERWRRAIANSPIPVMIHDEDDRVLQLSAGWTKFSGYTIEDIPTLADWTERAYGERAGFPKEYIDQLFSIDQTVNNGEWIVTAKDGSKRIWDFQTTPLGKAHAGKRVLHSLAIDITERKLAENALRENEQRLVNSQRAAKVGCWEWDLSTQSVIWSAEIYRIFGLAPEDYSPTSDSFAQLVHHDDLHVLYAENFNRAVAQKFYETEYRIIDQTTQKIKYIHLWAENIFDATQQPARIMGTMQDITERVQVETALRLSELELKEAQAVAHIGNWKWDLKKGEVIWSDEMYRIFGIEKNLYTGRLGDVIAKVIHPDDLHIVLPSNAQTLAEKKPIEYRIVMPDGSIRHIWAKAGDTIFDDNDSPAFLTGIAQDITERKQIEDQLRQLSRAVEQSPVSIMITDVEGKIEYVNPKFNAMTGYALDEVLGQNPRILKSGKTLAETYSEMWQIIRSGKEWRGEFLNRKKNGELYWESDSISAITDPKGTITHFVAVNEDITARKEAEEKIKRLNAGLEQLALTDYLTSLYNRRYFMQRGAEEFKRAHRNRQPLGLFMMDIDEFKKVNDIYGHEAGDMALQQVAAALKYSLRETDVLGRMGGEEFAVLLPNTSLKDAGLLAERVRKKLERTPFQTSAGTSTITITICIGVAAFSDGMSRVDDLLRNADKALYHAKQNGRNRVMKYKENLDQVSGLSSNLVDE